MLDRPCTRRALAKVARPESKPAQYNEERIPNNRALGRARALFMASLLYRIFNARIGPIRLLVLPDTDSEL